MEFTSILIPVVIILAALLAIGIILSRLYRRAEKDRAYVRTGLGGQKVVLDGGSLILPVFHNLAYVNLQTLRLDVSRKDQDALITKDRMRVDIAVEFYVRVKPDGGSIALAAQTLGNRTNNAEELRELVEAKFVDALRGVSATMDLAELQENRQQFVQTVQTSVARDLEQNGLELESASLTRLDQTNFEFFNPNNAFDAEGLTALTKITELKKQERNQTVRTAEVAIAQQDLEARQRTLEIERQKQEAALNQERDIANKTAATRAEKANKEADARQSEEMARIQAEQAIALRQAAAKQAQDTAKIEAELAIQQRRIQAEQAAAIANQERQIAVAQKSEEESRAKASAEDARSIATSAEEGVITAREVAKAERERQITVISARKEAERDAAHITIAAEADKQAAANRADAKRIEAQAEADAVRLHAEAKAKEYEVDAAGQKSLNEARNALSSAIIDLEIMKERLRIIPQALAEAVKPLEKIGDVKIIDFGGRGFPLNGAGTSVGALSGPAAGANGGNPAENLVNALMQYRLQSPLIDQLLKQAGLEGSDPVRAALGAIGGLAADTAGHEPPQADPQPAPPPAEGGSKSMSVKAKLKQ
jgi:flotillin